MSVEQIQAYRISDGRTFENKRQAYQEEVVSLLTSLPNVPKRGLSLAALEKSIAEAGAILTKIGTVKSGLAPDKDKRLIASIDSLTADLEAWHTKAVSLVSQVDGEPDDVVQKAVRTQE